MRNLKRDTNVYIISEISIYITKKSHICKSCKYIKKILNTISSLIDYDLLITNYFKFTKLRKITLKK